MPRRGGTGSTPILPPHTSTLALAGIQLQVCRMGPCVTSPRWATWSGTRRTGLFGVEGVGGVGGVEQDEVGLEKIIEVEVINLHLAKPGSLGNCLARFAELAVLVEEEVAAKIAIVVQSDFDDVHASIFSDVINGWRGRNLCCVTNVSGKSLGVSWEVGEVRWRTMVWQIVLPEIKLDEI